MVQGKFYDKLDYQQDRLQNWKQRQVRQVQAKKQIQQKENDSISQLQTKQKINNQNLQRAEKQLDKKILDSTKSIVLEKQQYEVQIGELDQKIDDLQKQMKKLINIREQLKGKAVKCQELVEKEKRNFVDEIKEIQNIKNSIGENDLQLKKSGESLSIIRQEIAQTIVKIQNHSKESAKVINQLQSDYDSLYSISSSIASQNKLRRATVMQINTVNKQIKQQQKEYIELKKNSQKARGQILELENQIDELKQRITTLSNSIANAENNKKKAASSRLFTKAAEIVKELKSLVSQKQNCEKQLDMLVGQMKNKGKLVDEQSLKLPELKMAIQDADLKLKKQQRSFLGMRLKQLQLLKNILNNDDYGQKQTDFKAISALQEEIVSSEQQLMRIKAHLKSRGVDQDDDDDDDEDDEDKVEEEIREAQHKKFRNDQQVKGQELELEEEKKKQRQENASLTPLDQSEQTNQNHKAQQQATKLQDNRQSRYQIEKAIENIDLQLEQIEQKIDYFSSCDQFQKAQELQEEEDRIKQEKKKLLDQLALLPQAEITNTVVVDKNQLQNLNKQKPSQLEAEQRSNNNKPNDQEEEEGGEEVEEEPIIEETELDPIPQKHEIQNDMKDEDQVDEQSKNKNIEQLQELPQMKQNKNNEQDQCDKTFEGNSKEEQQFKKQQLADEKRQQKNKGIEQNSPNQTTSNIGFSGGGLFSGMEIKS